MTTVALTEKPSIYHREEASVVIFPTQPYWFSATQEIEQILDAFSLNKSEEIISKISETFCIKQEEAKETYLSIEELLYSSGVLIKNGQILKPHEFSPDFQVNDVENVMVIATTQECNLSCPMCYAMASKKMFNEMNTQEIKSIVDQLVRMPWENRISRVALTGGELFMRPDAIELIEYVHQQGFFVQVNTNATTLSTKQIKRLSALPQLKMSVSLDGCQATSHEFIRGSGTFGITIDTIRSLCEQGVSVAINMFVHAGNLNEIKETLLLADNLGVSGFNCLNMMNVGRGNSKKTKETLVGVSLKDFYRTVFEAIRYDVQLQKLMINSTFANQIMGIAGGVKSHSCGIGTNRAVYVKADGTLYPCADTSLPAFCLGNLREDKLLDIWENSTLLKNLRSLNIDNLNSRCSACDVRYQCAGNCRGENYQTTGDIQSPHFKCEEIHDSILELMWILTEEPDIFKIKVDELYDKVSTHASMA